MDIKPRTFLVVADDSPEMTVALRYAAWRAHHAGGRVALLYVIEPTEIQPWRGVEKILMADAIAGAKTALRQHEDFVENMTGQRPSLYIRRGAPRTALLELLDDQPEISVLVLGAHTGPAGGPGPLVTFLTSPAGIRKLKIPLVLVPDTYKMEAENLMV